MGENMTFIYSTNACYSNNQHFQRPKCFSNSRKAIYFPYYPKIGNGSTTNYGYVNNTKLATILNQPKVSTYSMTTRACFGEEDKLKIAIIGFGNFGQFLAKEMVKQGHQVLAYSCFDKLSSVAKEIGVQFFKDADDLCEEHPEVVLLCTSIISTEKVLRSLPVYRLRRSTLFVDTLSVKEFPRALLLRHLPKDFDILCTHPMFGPDSANSGWDGVPFVYEKVRVGPDPAQTHRVETILNIFKIGGCKMVEMTCAEHDKYAARSQFITHLMGRVLEKVGLTSTPINTKGYESLLNLVDNTRDNFELFYGLFLCNKNAVQQLHKLEWAFQIVQKQLNCDLHESD